MTEAEPNLRGPKKSRRWQWIGAIALVCAIVVFSVIAIAVSRAEPILRASVIETLSTRFKSKVELDAFHVSLVKGLLVSGSGLRIFGDTDPNNHEPGFQPIISVSEFRFHLGLRQFLRTPKHVDTVFVKGLQLNLPPREHRDELNNMRPQGGKIKIVVDRFICDQAELIINTLRPGKLPVEFDIESLRMTRIGSDLPMHFDASLTNPKPVGRIISSGLFGPWQPDNPRQTPVSGTYSFHNADLGTIKGLGGTLSSTGNYAGILEKIVVDGATDTPDFRIATGDRPVPLHTDFHAIVDGTSGDTYLQPVKAKLLNTSLLANGSVVRTKDIKGHHVTLDVVIDRGKIEDLLKLAVHKNPPMVTGFVRLQTKFDLPPGEPDLANRLKLSGTFKVLDAHFTDEPIQQKLDALSKRSQGKMKDTKNSPADDVHSGLNGTFALSDGVLSFSQLEFTVPGTRVDLTGTYSLDGNQIDFHGKARLDAKLSQMVTGWKSVLLKPVDPFFSKDGAGTEVPVKVTGTKSDVHFGPDFGHKEDDKEPKSRAN
ncbi:MAG TPA: AsmA-like C-terminal region-containing protein [Terriglobales bacterium]|nr:AsmA-like C-terminal region-containing protein [Terriglobales bacterium]